jgi:hypothetical protein
MRILLRLISPPVVAEFEKGSKPGPGHRQIFSEDFGLEEYDGVAFNRPLAGSHSGFVTTLRIAKANDRLYPKDSFLFQYEAMYRFNGVPNTPLQKGQVTVRGVFFTDSNFTPVEPNTAAITGGTDAYRLARGQATPTPQQRLLNIQL